MPTSIACHDNGTYTDVPMKRCIDPEGRFCPDPPLEPENGGISTWDSSTMRGRTRFGTTVTYRDGKKRWSLGCVIPLRGLPHPGSRNLGVIVLTVAYSCGQARQLRGQDEGGETLFYDEFEITCLWNRTYDKNPSLVS